jgi:hypothetical protein
VPMDSGIGQPVSLSLLPPINLRGLAAIRKVDVLPGFRLIEPAKEQWPQRIVAGSEKYPAKSR